jgi:hypothetical protein
MPTTSISRSQIVKLERRAHVPATQRETCAQSSPSRFSGSVEQSSMTDVQVTLSPSWVIEPTGEIRSVQASQPRRRVTLVLPATWVGPRYGEALRYGPNHRRTVVNRARFPLDNSVSCQTMASVSPQGRVRALSSSGGSRRLWGESWPMTIHRRDMRLLYPAGVSVHE